MLNLRVPEHVRHQSQEHGGVVILDTAGGEWLALNVTAGDLWRAWEAGAEFEHGVTEVAARYPDIPVETIRDDAQRLVTELVSRGLIEAAISDTADDRHSGEAVMAEAAAGAVDRPEWRLAAPAFVCLVVASAAVRYLPFRTSLALVRGSRRHWCRTAEPVDGAALVAAVGWAVRRYPGRAACLEQSLAAVLLAAAGRRRLDWCLGAAVDPYRFHAWVEAAGRPVTAPGDPQSTAAYVRMLTV